MARVSGVTLPNNKRIEIALTYIYGIGLTRSKKILAETGLDKNKRVKDLSEAETDQLRDVIKQSFVVEGDLRREKLLAIRRLKDNGSFRGSRHAKGLPARGQTTRRNSRTVRGNKRFSAGSGRRATGQKT